MMQATRRGYVMSMLAGSAIIAACTLGAIGAQPAVQSDAAASGEALAGVSDPGVSAATDTAPTSVPSAMPSPTPPQSPAPGAGAGSAAEGDDDRSASTGPASSSGSVAASPRTAPSVPTPTGPGTRIPATPTTAPAQPTTPASTRPSASSPAPAATKYKDGTYSATGSYNSPGGIEKLGVTLTLVGDKVAGSKLDLQGEGGISKSYQGLFRSGYASQVVGRPIDSVHLGAVAGSSLTALGFNQALAQIQAQARG